MENDCYRRMATKLQLGEFTIVWLVLRHIKRPFNQANVGLVRPLRGDRFGIPTGTRRDEAFDFRFPGVHLDFASESSVCGRTAKIWHSRAIR
jgi:hypothetical protein